MSVDSLIELVAGDDKTFNIKTNELFSKETIIETQTVLNMIALNKKKSYLFVCHIKEM